MSGRKGRPLTRWGLSGDNAQIIYVPNNCTFTFQYDYSPLTDSFHPNLDGNIRDHATLQQPIILSNIESLNAVMIKQGVSRRDRLVELNRIAKEQMSCLLKWDVTNRLEDYNHIGR